MQKKRSTKENLKRIKPAKRAAKALPAPEGKAAQVPIVGVGASAGGLEAIWELVKALTLNSGLAFVIIQHLDPDRDSALVELIGRASALPVSEAKDGLAVEANRVYVITPNTLLSVRGGVLRISPRQEGHGLNLPIDFFFQALAEDQGSKAIGVILSGSASDGTQGMKAIKAAGGITFAQDKSAKFDGMPRSAIATDCVDYVLPPADIARELIRIGRHAYLSDAAEVDLTTPVADDAELAHIFTLLRQATRVDFTYYKHNTLKRRIMRRMALARIDTLKEYVAFLRSNPVEVDALYQDVLINVTKFFRDPETFEFLKKDVFPQMISNRSSKDVIRLWVPGCSTGEEVYSLAICLLEYLEDSRTSIPIKIFATDISDSALAKARAGAYTPSISQEVSPGRLRKYFLQIDAGYQVCKAIRDAGVFSKHDVTRDPPFSNLDLVSCRNVLIYLGSVLQKGVLPIFYYALKPTGFLLLGSSENTYSESFYAVDKKHNLYRKKMSDQRPAMPFAISGYPLAVGPRDLVPERYSSNAEIQKEADRLVLARYAPAGVVCNADLQILQFRGQTGPYLEPAAGAASLSLLKMAREGLIVELRQALQAAQKGGKQVIKEGLQIKTDGDSREINLLVVPFFPTGSRHRHFIVLFEDQSVLKMPLHRPDIAKLKHVQPVKESRRIADLQGELTATKDYLQSVIEELEAGNEELKSANEEIMSSNEELQSTNEELETTKEELQATNEELTTVNEELETRGNEVALANSDLMNLLSCASIPIIMLGRDLRIRRFTPSAQKLLNLIPADIGRPLSDLKPLVEFNELEAEILAVIETLVVKVRDVKTRDEHWYTMIIRPYRTVENKIDGAVITLMDIDTIKRSEAQMLESRDYVSSIVETLREAVVVLDSDLRVKSANRSFYRMANVDISTALGKTLVEIDGGLWNTPALSTQLTLLVTENKAFENFEFKVERSSTVTETYLINARRIQRDGQAGGPLILLAIEDISARRRAESVATARERLAIVGEIAAGVAHEFRNPLHGVLNCVKILRDQISNKDLTKWLDLQEEGLRRMDNISSRMLRLAREESGTKTPTDVGSLVNGAMEMVMPRAHREHVQLDCSIEPNLPKVPLDAERVTEALLNLLTNAIDACSKDSKIMFKASKWRMESGEMLCLSVTDNGAGIPAEMVKSVFEPFFTTKPIGKGSGLGLAIVKRIVESHNGTVELISEPGKGTTVRLFLPLGA